MVILMIKPKLLHPGQCRTLDGVLKIVEGDISQITRHKSCPEYKSKIAHDQIKKTEEDRRQEDTGQRWHGQPGRINRVLMMNGVSGELDTIKDPGVGLGVIYKSVDHILSEGPKGIASDK